MAVFVQLDKLGEVVEQAGHFRAKCETELDESTKHIYDACSELTNATREIFSTAMEWNIAWHHRFSFKAEQNGSVEKNDAIDAEAAAKNIFFEAVGVFKIKQTYTCMVYDTYDFAFKRHAMAATAFVAAKVEYDRALEMAKQWPQDPDASSRRD